MIQRSNKTKGSRWLEDRRNGGWGSSKELDEADFAGHNSKLKFYMKREVIEKV